MNYDGHNLTVAGSIDLTYYHRLEIIFEDVFFVSGVFTGWHSDTDHVVIKLPDDEYRSNIRFENQKGYELFIMKTEDFENDFIIAAKTVSFNIDTVFYYDREELKENERLASFVKKT